MEEWVRNIFEQEKEKRKKPLEVKKLGNNYYLYISTTVWDKEERKRKKLSRYIGRITSSGLIEGRTEKYNVRTIFEYGNAKLLFDIAEEIISPLRKVFPNCYKEIIAMSIVKTIQNTPLKLIKSKWEKLYLSKEISASLSPNTLTNRLKIIGSDWNSEKLFYDHLLLNTKHLIFDLSSIISYSENLHLAEKGYNSNHLYLKQVNFALIFSQDMNIPVAIKVLPGSIRDIKSFKYMIDEMNLSSSVIVLDRGFASYDLPGLLKEKKMKFILPLRRNFEMIDYSVITENCNCFTYRNRGIYWGSKKIDSNFLYLFEDVKLRAEEETVFIDLRSSGIKDKDDLLKEKNKFGRIAILSNIEDDGKNIYSLYKSREEVEIAFDSMKNEMENDKTYLSDDDSVRGYFFISFISLYLYFRILNILRQRDLIGKISVQELLFELSKVYIIYYNDGKKRLSEITKKAERLDKLLELNLFPKELMS